MARDPDSPQLLKLTLVNEGIAYPTEADSRSGRATEMRVQTGRKTVQAIAAHIR